MTDHDPPASPSSQMSNPQGSVPRLTNRQLSVVRDLAQGWDIATIAEQRGRGLSSVYEIAGRICERMGLDEWSEIGPYAVTHGLLDTGEQKNPDYDGWQNPEHPENPENPDGFSLD